MAGVDPQKLFDVEGMVVVITGGGTGIGHMMTKAFALNGAAKVYIIGRRKDKLEETAKISPSNIVPIVGDVTSKESLMAAAAQIKSEVGFVNLLINNSGSMPPPVPVLASEVPVDVYAKAALELDPEDWKTTYATNTIAVVFGTFAFLELLDAGNKKGNCTGRWSQVIVTSSVAGYLRIPGANMGYGGSKVAATHMVKHLAGTLVPYSIRINGIAPGLFPSVMSTALVNHSQPLKDDPTEDGGMRKSVVPAERIGRESDMAGTVLYMASTAGAFLNGQITLLDGGSTSQNPGVY